MDYLSFLKTAPTAQIRQLSETGRLNIEKLFKGFPKSPRYVAGATDVAGWDVRYQPPGPEVMRGYFLPLSPCEGDIALVKDGSTWMSVTPMELESHLLPYAFARGHTVVAGLGLGMIAINLLARQAVRRLTVLEYDAELIEHFPLLLVDESRELWDKALESGRLEVFQADCRQRISQSLRQHLGRVDYLWVDIWEHIGSPSALADTQFLCNQIKARQCDYWGMELDILKQVMQLGGGRDPARIYAGIERLKLPCSPLSFSKAQKEVYVDLVLNAGVHTFAFGSDWPAR